MIAIGNRMTRKGDQFERATEYQRCVATELFFPFHEVVRSQFIAWSSEIGTLGVLYVSMCHALTQGAATHRYGGVKLRSLGLTEGPLLNRLKYRDTDCIVLLHLA